MLMMMLMLMIMMMMTLMLMLMLMMLMTKLAQPPYARSLAPTTELNFKSMMRISS